MSTIRSFTAYLLAACLLSPAGCGEAEDPAQATAGAYVLDRKEYVRLLVEARHPIPEPPGKDLSQEERAEIEQTIRRARKVAKAVSLRLELAADGTFVVSYRFPKERGTRRGAWRREGSTLSLRITHDAAGPVQRGAAVAAQVVDEGIRISGWPVPNAFLLRRQ